MSVPVFEDLGKSARDVFRTGFYYDQIKLKLVGQPKDVGVETDGVFDLKSHKADVAVLGKYQHEGTGQYSVKYTYDGPVVGEFSTNGVYSKNWDVEAGCSANLADSFQTLKLRGKYHNDSLYSTLSVTKDLDRSVDLLGSLVLKFSNILVGYRAGYDTDTSRLTKNDVAVAADLGDIALHFRCIQIPKEVGLSAFLKINDKMDLAVDAKMAPRENPRPWFAGVGLHYKLDDTTKLRVKMDKNLQLGTSVQLKLVDSVLLSLAFNLDVTKPKHGQHRVGFGIEVTA